jgi:hypothetical protein
MFIVDIFDPILIVFDVTTPVPAFVLAIFIVPVDEFVLFILTFVNDPPRFIVLATVCVGLVIILQESKKLAPSQMFTVVVLDGVDPI